MKKRATLLLLLAGSILAYAQNDNNQGNESDHPAVPSKGLGEIRPHSWIHRFIGPNVTQAATVIMMPSQITGAYGINTVPGGGQGATVAIVDAYDSPNAASDLATFMAQWGISCSTGGGTFTKVNQSGNPSPLPVRDLGWEVEINLDTQWVRALAPCANIVLVEANSNNTGDLMTAVSTAASLGSVVSMSWGGGEFSGQTSLDSYFVKSGVTFLASSGDTGGLIEWPSSSPNVIAVGGTNLTLGSGGSVASETAWSGSGGGCSAMESAIGPQTGFVPSSCTSRATPDVSMDGGDMSPVYVLISGQGGWFSVYGTSLSVQLWAAVISLANGMRSAPLNGTLGQLYTDAAGAPSSALYIDNYRDITSGSAGSFSAGAGWDFVTGLGSPLVNSLVPAYLAKQAASADFSLSSSPGSQTVSQGGGTSYTATVTPSNGFTGSVSLAASGLPSGANASFNPTSISGGSGSSSMSVNTGTCAPGTYTLTITGTSGSLVHTSSVTLVVNAAAQPDFSVSATPSSQTVVAGSGTSYTATVNPSNGFSSSVGLTASGLPAGASASFNPTSVSNGSWSSTMSVSTTTSTPAGTYTLTITGTSSPLVHSTTVKLVVTDFSVSGSPASQTVVQGSGTSYTATVTALDGFSGTVTFSTGALPAGVGASFNPGSVSGSGPSTMSVTTSSTTPVGTYTLTITGTSGSLAHSTTVKLVVNAASSGDFSISASPGSRTISRNSSTTYTVTVTGLSGFAGQVNLSVSGTPSHTSVSFNPSSVTGSGTSTLKVTTGGKTPRGTFTLTITGSSGSLSHSTTVTLIVQ